MIIPLQINLLTDIKYLRTQVVFSCQKASSAIYLSLETAANNLSPARLLTVVDSCEI